MQRRHLFRPLGAAGLAGVLAQCANFSWAAGSAPAAVAAPGVGAAAAAASDYKALVCVFLFGGNDGNNMVVPLDARHADYARLRGPLLALPRERLVPLADAGAGSAGSATYGLHPGLAPLAPLWQSGRLALQFNAGALLEPLTRADYLRSAARPDNLFSHFDQQDFAQSLQDPGGARSGWGFRLAAGQQGPGTGVGRLPPLISLAGSPRFMQGSVRGSLVLPARGNFGLSGNADSGAGAARMEALRAVWAQGGGTAIGRQAGDVLASALDAAAFVNPLINPPAGATPGAAALPFAELNTDIAQQLLRVARLIEARAAVGNRRQVFFVSMNGFDTHTNQRNDQDRLLGELGSALRAFHDATESMGVAQQVTSFTLSDFARTFRPNNSGGSDHAWGNHQLLLGGAVKGGQTYGRFPLLEPGGPEDAAREGRWIPSTSFDQVAATLARWFGADAAALTEIAPHLSRFDRADLGFMA